MGPGIYLGFYSWGVGDKIVIMPTWLIHTDFLLYAERSGFLESIGVLAYFCTVNIMLKINLHIFAYFCALINYMWIWYLNASEEHLPACGDREGIPTCHILLQRVYKMIFLKFISDYSNSPLSRFNFPWFQLLVINCGLNILNKKYRNKKR